MLDKLLLSLILGIVILVFGILKEQTLPIIMGILFIISNVIYLLIKKESKNKWHGKSLRVYLNFS